MTLEPFKVNHIVLYGSLQRGQIAFKRLGLAKYLKFLRPVRFPGKLYDLGEYPGAVLAGEGQNIAGELYEILSDEVLPKLDEFEEYNEADQSPRDFENGRGSLYLRQTIEVSNTVAYVYVYNAPNIDNLEKPIVPSGDWLKHKGVVREI